MLVARSRFELLSPGFFSPYEIQSLESLALNLGDWPLDSAPNFVGFDRANTSYIKPTIRPDILTLSIDLSDDKTIFQIGLFPHVGNEAIVHGVDVLISDKDALYQQ
jgi:hypothetical protein